MINGAPISATGRVAVDTGVSTPVTSNAGLSYMADGSLACSTTAGAPTGWAGGLGLIGKRLSIVDRLALPLPVGVQWSFGLPINQSDQLVCTSTEPVAMWNHGWPQSAIGAVCIGVGAPVVNAFTNGFNTGFD